jgi:hypothetical protein
MNFEVSQRIFEKDSNIKFSENPSSGSRVVPCGRTGRQTHDETNSCFRKFTTAPKNIVNKYGLYTGVSEILTLSCALVRLTLLSFPSIAAYWLLVEEASHLYLLS